MHINVPLPRFAATCGLTPGQVDHWRRAHVVPGAPGDPGDADTLLACLLTIDLLHAGAGLDQVHAVTAAVWAAGPEVAARALAVCSGTQVVLACTTDEVVAALNTGRGVIVVSVASAVARARELFALTLADHTGDTTSTGEPPRLRIVA